VSWGVGAAWGAGRPDLAWQAARGGGEDQRAGIGNLAHRHEQALQLVVDVAAGTVERWMTRIVTISVIGSASIAGIEKREVDLDVVARADADA
jgi:hypothetical protein